jgi:hypothetical protein
MNSYVGPYNVLTLSIFLQLGYKFGVWNMYGACTELVSKLVKFCTNLHTLFFWHLSKKIHSRQISADTQ